MSEEKGFVRIKSGIPGLDKMIEDGFPFPSTILVAGSAGTGKTTFSLQFLSEGAREGDQCMYFTTLSEPVQWMLRFVSQFKFVNKDFFGKEIVYVELGDMFRKMEDPLIIIDKIEDYLTEYMPQRIVIDPVTVVGGTQHEAYRVFLYDLVNRLKTYQTVSVLTGEVLPDEPYPPEVSYVVDGVILLTFKITEEGNRKKYLEVLKMRGTNHATGLNLVDISSEGMIVQYGLR